MINAGLRYIGSLRLTGRLAPTGYDVITKRESDDTDSKFGVFNTDYSIGTWVKKTVDLAASASSDIVLNDDSLVDQFGEPVTFTALRFALFICESGPSGVRIGGAASNPFPLWNQQTDAEFNIYPYGPPLSLGGASLAVSGTADTIKVLNLDGAATAQVTAYFAGAIT